MSGIFGGVGSSNMTADDSIVAGICHACGINVNLPGGAISALHQS